MSDLISRAAAIDAPEKLIKDCNPDHFVGHQKFIEFMDNAEIGSFGKWQFANGFNMGLTAVEVTIKKLPSAQPEQRWITCGERLPEDEQPILFSTTTGRVHQGRFHRDNSVNRWYSSLDKMRAYNNVVNAWMPLPEPYKEDDHD